ncbi:MAG: ribbon-helix-helix domain-containing protein [Candidatus Nanohaloarchaea archaeon]|nr:ribbon-helix-helix domain-containing protein [Candidatus Nanohaloarchaea archaeon]
MAISAELPDNLERLVEWEMEQGNYRSKSELIRDALRDHFQRRGKIEHRSLSDTVTDAIDQAQSGNDTGHNASD